MQVGNNWGGNYSRFTFDENDRYMYMMKVQGKPVLDDEFNLLQEILTTSVRRLGQHVGNGSRNNGFQIVGTGASNNFTIKGGDGTIDGAGRILIAGYSVLIPSDTTYSAQPITQSALTTPGAPRTDEVYLDVWLDEIDGTDDADIIDPSLATETSRRLKLYWAVKVAEGGVTPVDYTDGNNLRHHTLLLAQIFRTATSAINAGMVGDRRSSATPAFFVHRNGVNTPTANNGVVTKIQFDTVNFDQAFIWDTASTWSGRIQKPGKYILGLSVQPITTADGMVVVPLIYINGVEKRRGGTLQPGGGAVPVSFVLSVEDLVANDTVEFYFQIVGGVTSAMSGNLSTTYGFGVRIG